MKYGWGKEIAGLWRNLKVQGAQTGLEIQFGCTGSLMGNCKGINFGPLLRLQLQFKPILANNLIFNMSYFLKEQS